MASQTVYESFVSKYDILLKPATGSPFGKSCIRFARAFDVKSLQGCKVVDPCMRLLCLHGSVGV